MKFSISGLTMRGTWGAVALTAMMLVLGGCSSDSGDGDGDAVNGDGPGVTGDTNGIESSTEPDPVDDIVRVAFTREARVPSATMPDEVQLVVGTTECLYSRCEDDLRPVIVGGFDFACPNHACRMAASGEYVFFRPADDTDALAYAPLDSNYQLTEAGTLIDGDVRRFEIRGDRVAWISAEETLHAFDAPSARRWDLGPTDGGDAQARGAGFAFTEDGGSIIRMAYSLSTMLVSYIDLDADTEDQLYRIVSGTVLGSGSYFSGREPAMVSSVEDGFLFIGAESLTLSNGCGSNTDCEEGTTCLTGTPPARCGSYDTWIARINMNQVDRLDGSCGSDSDCGSGHRCDRSYIDPATNRGACLPSNLVIGPGGSTACNRWEEGDWSDIRGPIGERADGWLVFAAATECRDGFPGANIDNSALLAVNPTFGEVTELTSFGSPIHPGEGCYDSIDDAFNFSQCVTELRTSVMSRSGASVVSIGNSPGSRQSDAVWVFDAYGNGEPKPLEMRAVSNESDTFRILAVTTLE